MWKFNLWKFQGQFALYSYITLLSKKRRLWNKPVWESFHTRPTNFWVLVIFDIPTTWDYIMGAILLLTQ